MPGVKHQQRIAVIFCSRSLPVLRKTWKAWPWWNPGITVKRSGKPWQPISPWRLIIFVISAVSSVPKRERVVDVDAGTVSMEVHEPLGVVGQIIPWNFPILMATWKLAPALAAGNCIVLKPAEQTPVSILFLMEAIADLLPAGVLNIVNGFGPEAGKPLATHPDIKKIAFTGETTTGRLIMQYASENLIPGNIGTGWKVSQYFL